MIQDKITNEYFEWMYGIVCGEKRFNRYSCRKLLIFLHNTEFVYSIPMDSNRAKDGVNLRIRFADDYDYENILAYLNTPCSVLEMMIALCIRCEEQIMDDPDVGNRTGQWFWTMIDNLGLISMTDDRFDKRFVQRKIDIFLNRKYDADGKGGLFTVEDCNYDLRTVEIWYQMCWYLNSIL